MTDPERISRRGAGLAAELLRASADEQPGDSGMQRTLAALGASSAVLTITNAAGAAAGASGAKLTGAATVGAGAALSTGAGKAVTATLLVKWIGVGIVGGVGLAGAAAVVASPVDSPPAPASAPAARVAVAPLLSSVTPSHLLPAPPRSVTEAEGAAPAPTTPPLPRPTVSVRETAAVPPLDVGAPLSEEVTFVDRARALLATGQAEAGLAQLAGYEREFPEARLLPEVLFLQLEAYERLGRPREAKRAAQRLVSGFPRSPHAARARALLAAHFP